MADHQKAHELRGILGNEPAESTIYFLLETNGNDVNAAADAYFQGTQLQMPRAAAVAASEQDCVVQATVPEGVRAGGLLRVRTPRGLMQVKVPAGLSPGDTFLVRVPPSNASRSTLPQTIIVREAPVVVHSYPYTYPPGYGYGYGYHDPFLPGAVGFLGGMVIADALFW